MATAKVCRSRRFDIDIGDDDDNIEIVVIKVHNKMPYLTKLQDLPN